MSRYYNDELYHFGINGQKWGIKHGPPYPLSYSAHSQRQKKENAKRIIGGVSNANSSSRKEHRKKNSNRNKKIALAAGVTATAILVGYGLYKTGALDKAVAQLGKKRIDNLDLKGLDLDGPSYKKLSSEHRTFDKVIGEANPTKSKNNCFAASSSVIGRMLGIDCTAKSESFFKGEHYSIGKVLNILGVKDFDNLGNSTIKTIRNHDGTLNSAYTSMSNQLKRGKLKDGDVGVIAGNVLSKGGYGDHIFNWCIQNDKIVFGDGQRGYNHRKLMEKLHFNKNSAIEWAKVANINDTTPEELLNGLHKLTDM